MNKTEMDVDFKKGIVKGPEGTITLTPRERDLLACLAGRAGCAVSRNELLSAAWGWTNVEYVRTKTVDMHVSRLRTKLSEIGIGSSTIQTVRGEGYRLTAVRSCSQAAR